MVAVLKHVAVHRGWYWGEREGTFRSAKIAGRSESIRFKRAGTRMWKRKRSPDGSRTPLECVLRPENLLVRAVAILAAARELVVGCLLGCGALDVVASLENGLLDVFRLDLGIVVCRREFLRVLVPRGI